MNYVYFIRALDGTGPIKVGSSYWPHNRLKQMCCWSPIPLTLVAQTEGSEFHERALHDKFDGARAHGEWFHPVPELVALMDAVAGGATLAELGIEAARCSTRVNKTAATRLKQSVTLRLNWAMKAAYGDWFYSHDDAAPVLPEPVRSAVKQWRESVDVRPLTEQREIIEAHIADLKRQAA